jgi:hypothetical protein
MMALDFGDLADLHYKIESRLEIGKIEGTQKVVAIDDFPLRQLARKLLQFFAGERRHAAFARDAILFCQFSHALILRPLRVFYNRGFA